MKRKINILHATLYLGMGGLETVIMDLCSHGDRNAFKYNVLCLNSYDSVYKRELENYGVSVFSINRKGRYDIMFFAKIVRLLKQQKIDVLHAHSGCVFNSLICARLAGVPVRLFTEHGLPFWDDGSPMAVNFKTRLEEWLIGRLAKKIIGVSSEIGEDLLQRYSESKDKICVVPNGIDTQCFTTEVDASQVVCFKDKYDIPEDKFIVGSVGRLVRVKNYPCLIRAFAILQNKTETKDKFHLVLVGDGDEKANLENLAAELGVKQNVSFLGRRYDIERVLPIFNVFVLPSFTEGTSISLLEALSCGVPVVVTDVGGNPNIVNDGENGFLCAVDDAFAISERLRQLQRSSELLSEMSKYSRAGIIKKFSVSGMVSKYQNLYSGLVLR